MYLLIILLWAITTVIYFHSELKAFFAHQKKNEDDKPTSDNVFGKAQTIFLPVNEVNLRQIEVKKEENINDEDFDEIDNDGFEVTYAIENNENELERERVTFDEEPIPSFGDIQQMTTVATNKTIDITKETDDEVIQARKTAKLVRETELIALMLKNQSEITARMEQMF